MRNSLALAGMIFGVLLGFLLGNMALFVAPSVPPGIPPEQVTESTLSEVTIEPVSNEILQEVNGQTISAASFTGDFTGPISGPFVAEFVFTIQPNGVFEGIGYVTCNCTVNERSGILVERYTLVGGAGSQGEVISRGTWEIVRGTADLSSLRGGGAFESSRFPGELEQGTKTGRIQFV